MLVIFFNLLAAALSGAKMRSAPVLTSNTICGDYWQVWMLQTLIYSFLGTQINIKGLYIFPPIF